MRADQINRVSGKVILGLSLIALVTVLMGYTHPRHQPELDEGAGAHIFQIAIVFLLPTVLLFLATADWKQPWRSARSLAFPAAALVAAFAALYYLEHYWLR